MTCVRLCYHSKCCYDMAGLGRVGFLAWPQYSPSSDETRW